MEVTSNSSENHYWLLASILLNVVANFDKTNITFGLGVIVSILAIINYVIQIKKNLKKRK